MVPTGEAIRTLNLLRYIASRYKNIGRRENIIYSNNKTNIKNINTKARRESDVI